jgi:hypothetical protein
MNIQADTTAKGDKPGHGGGGGGKAHTVTIIVNTIRHPFEKNENISFEEVVSLAYNGNPPSGPNVGFTVMWRRGHGNKDGALAPGETVKVKDGMIFDVSATDRS